MKQVIYSNYAPEPIGPYSQAIKCNGLLFVSGQIPINQETGELITKSIEEETHQVMDNIGHILQEVNLKFKSVVKCTIFVKDMDNFPVINEIYGKYFSANHPARETVEVSKLPKNVNVEISCIAQFEN